MPSHLVSETDTLRSVAELYYGTADAQEALARMNGLTAGAGARPGSQLSLPARLLHFGGFSERSEMKSVVEMRAFERRKDLVFVTVEENVYPGGPGDLVPISGKWLYVIRGGAIVVRAEARETGQWKVDNQLFGGRREVADATITLLKASDYSFFVAPFELAPDGEQYLLRHVDELITASHLKAVDQDTKTFVRDAYLWSLDLHHKLYMAALRPWQEWIGQEERSAKLFIASSLKCMIEQVDSNWLYDDFDPLAVRSQLNAGEPERYIEQVYQKEERRQRSKPEQAMARLATMIDSYDFRVLEQSALECGEGALAASVIVLAGVLECAVETQPGRELAMRLVRDKTRIPMKLVLTLTPSSYDLELPQYRYAINALLAIVKDLVPAWVSLRQADSGAGRMAQLASYVERLSGQTLVLERVDLLSATDTAPSGGRIGPQGVQTQPRGRLRLLDAESSAAEKRAALPSSLFRCERLNEAYVRTFGKAHTGLRYTLEAVNLSNAIGDVKKDHSTRKVLGVVGAVADFGALLTESLAVFAMESSGAGFKGNAAALGFVSGICDCIEFGMSAGEATGRHDYDQAVGLGIASTGAGMIAVGSAIALSGAIEGAVTAAAAGASVAGTLSAATAGGSIGGIVGMIGGALVGVGAVVARLCMDSSYQEFAKLCFLGEDHGTVKREALHWTSVRLPAAEALRELSALLQLVSNFHVAFDDTGLSINPGFCRGGDVFEIYFERSHGDDVPRAALLEADIGSESVRQLSGSRVLLDGAHIYRDKEGRPERLWLSDSSLEPSIERPSGMSEPGLEPSRKFLSRQPHVRRACVRLRLSDGSFVPPEPADKPSPQWVEVTHGGDFAIEAAMSSQPVARADLKNHDLLVKTAL